MFVYGQSGCIRAKVVKFRQSGCIRAKMVELMEKVDVIGKVVVFGQSGIIWIRADVFLHSDSIGAKWMYSG